MLPFQVPTICDVDIVPCPWHLIQTLRLFYEVLYTLPVFIRNWHLVDPGFNRESTVCISYVAGLIEDFRRVCGWFGITMTFKSGPTLRLHLVKMKDEVPTSMKSNVMYRVPCSCGKVYIGETIRRLETRKLHVRNMRMHARRGQRKVHYSQACVDHQPHH